MEPKRYILWSTNKVDLNAPFQRKWYIKQVLTYGRAEDIATLDFDEIKRLLPQLNLPVNIKKLFQCSSVKVLSVTSISFCKRKISGNLLNWLQKRIKGLTYTGLQLH